MGTKVTVISTPKNRVSVNNQQRATIRTVTIAPEQISNRLSGLTDVDASSPDNNDTLVYDSATGKYVIKELPIVNGGTF
jgi:hypothetical protein